MLIYNSKKDFLGIDEQDLRALGYQNLAELRAESEEFANLFIKTPGYIHNFKHVHWIDFVSCVESGEEAKVIIYAKEKAYKATLHIKNAYLVDHPTDKSYLINFQNLRALTAAENAEISADISQREIPNGAVGDVNILDNTSPQEQSKPLESINTNITEDPYENISLDDFSSNVINDEYDEAPINISLDHDTETPKEPEPKIELEQKDECVSIDLNDDLIIPMDTEEETPLINQEQSNDIDILDIMLDDEEILMPEIDQQEEKVTQPTNSQDTKEEPVDDDEYEYIEVEVEDEDEESDGYTFDPQVASDELGLTMELIEEFMEDFIAQADEFKPELYSSLDAGDFEEVKKLSHMLKGVAANLRVEDAKDTLVIINTSNDIDEVHKNLDKFYKIMAKLAGKEIPKKKIMQKVKKVKSEPHIIKEKIEEKIDVIDEDNDDLLLMDDDLLLAEDDSKVIEKEEVKFYDKTTISNQLGLDLDSFEELLNDYKNEALELSKSIQSSINDNNATKWKEQVSSLKSMNENMRIELFNDELNILLETDSKDRAKVAIDKIINIIPTIGG